MVRRESANGSAGVQSFSSDSFPIRFISGTGHSSSSPNHGTCADLDGVQIYSVVALSFVLAVLTWRYIENPFRRKHLLAGRPILFRVAGLTMAVGLTIGTAGHASLGWKGRLPLEALRLESAESDFNARRNQCHDSDTHVTPYEQKCVYGALDVIPRYAIWGDSHASELVIGLGEIAKAHGQAILQISYTECPPSFSEEAPSGTRCRDHNNAVFRKLVADSSKKLVFLNSRYREKLSEAGFRAVVEGLLASGKKVAIIYPFPSADNSVPVLLTSAVMHGRNPEALSISYSEYQRENTRGFAFLDSLPRGQNSCSGLPGQAPLYQSGLCDYEKWNAALFRQQSYQRRGRQISGTSLLTHLRFGSLTQRLISPMSGIRAPSLCARWNCCDRFVHCNLLACAVHHYGTYP